MIHLELDLHFDRKHAALEAPLPVSVRLVNAMDRDIVVHPESLSIRLIQVEIFEHKDFIGRCGGFFRSGSEASGCRLWNLDFSGVAPKSTFTKSWGHLELQPVTLVPELCRAYAYPFPGFSRIIYPGRYQVVATYTFDRKAYAARCPLVCPTHNDSARPWNRCLTRPLQAEAEFVILP